MVRREQERQRKRDKRVRDDDPRQIVAFRAEASVKARTIQGMVDVVPAAESYFTDGGTVYLDVDFVGRHRRNVRDKSETHG